jgi:hypothetical protein
VICRRGCSDSSLNGSWSKGRNGALVLGRGICVCGYGAEGGILLGRIAVNILRMLLLSGCKS